MQELKSPNHQLRFVNAASLAVSRLGQKASILGNWFTQPTLLLRALSR